MKNSNDDTLISFYYWFKVKQPQIDDSVDNEEEPTRHTTLAEELDQLEYIDENAATDKSCSDIASSDQELGLMSPIEPLDMNTKGNKSDLRFIMYFPIFTAILI